VKPHAPEGCTCGEDAEWLHDERFRVHYYPALIDNDDGTQRSLWPEKWPLEYLQGMKHTRSFALNYMNRPIPRDGTYWSEDDIVVEPMPEGLLTRTILSVDPAVTTKTSSDFTGLAVLSHSPQSRDRNGMTVGTGKVYIRRMLQVKQDPKSLRMTVVGLLEEFPEIRVILVEINQGGDLWANVFGDLPVKYVTKHQSIKKEVRAGWFLNGYQRRRIVHTEEMPTYNAQLLAFPSGLNDDLIDAGGSGYTWLTGIGNEQRTTLGRQTV
jgi:hypothetical protein